MGQHRGTLSPQEGRRQYVQATYHRHGNTHITVRRFTLTQTTPRFRSRTYRKARGHIKKKIVYFSDEGSRAFMVENIVPHAYSIFLNAHVF